MFFVESDDFYEGDMILIVDQCMVVEMGLDVDDLMGRGLIKNRQWLGGVMVYVIDFSLCKYMVYYICFLVQ